MSYYHLVYVGMLLERETYCWLYLFQLPWQTVQSRPPEVILGNLWRFDCWGGIFTGHITLLALSVAASHLTQIQLDGAVNHHHHNRFTALFPRPPRWAGARRELLDFMVQGKINRGRHTDHPAGRHSFRTNQCPPPPFPYFLQPGCPSCRPANSVEALKAVSAFGLGRRC